MVAGLRRNGGPRPGRGSELDRGQRFALFSAVRERLDRAAERSGLLLVLDDIQWADEPSLLLLAYLVRQLRGVRMLILATCREPAGDRLATRSGCCPQTRIPNGPPWPGCPHSPWAHSWRRPGRMPRPGRRRRCTRRPAATRSWSASWCGCAPSSPGRRPDRCPPPCWMPPRDGSGSSGWRSQDVLRAAAVAGHNFSVGVVAQMLGVAVLALLDPVEEGQAAGSVVSGDRPGDYRFSHALVRSAVVARLSAADQLRWHNAGGRRDRAVLSGAVAAAPGRARLPPGGGLAAR